jgi:hypothetical protein
MPDSPELETAKERLKVALKRLEKVLDKRLRDAEVKIAQADSVLHGKTIAGAPENKAMVADIESLKKQIKHMEEENNALRNELGGARDRSKTLEQTQEQVAQRVDGVIGSIKTILRNQGV